MRNRFENKHVLITGGARGIGLEIAGQFAREGALITIFDNHQENLTSALEEFQKAGVPVKGERIDVSDRTSVFEGVEKAENWAAVDILVNNAGIAAETPFLEMEGA